MCCGGRPWPVRGSRARAGGVHSGQPRRRCAKKKTGCAPILLRRSCLSQPCSTLPNRERVFFFFFPSPLTKKHNTKTTMQTALTRRGAFPQLSPWLAGGRTGFRRGRGGAATVGKKESRRAPGGLPLIFWPASEERTPAATAGAPRPTTRLACHPAQGKQKKLALSYGLGQVSARPPGARPGQPACPRCQRCSPTGRPRPSLPPHRKLTHTLTARTLPPPPTGMAPLPAARPAGRTG